MPGVCGSRAAALTLVAALAFAPAPGRAAELTQVRANAFPNAKALPLHAGIATGICATAWRPAASTSRRRRSTTRWR